MADWGTRSSCSSTVSNTVANDATRELQRIRELLESRGQLMPHAAKMPSDRLMSPKRTSSAHRPILKPTRHGDSATAIQRNALQIDSSKGSLNASSIATRSSRTTRNLSTPRNGDAQRLRSKIQATLRSSKEMQAILVRQHEMLEQANKQLAAFAVSDRRSFH